MSAWTFFFVDIAAALAGTACEEFCLNVASYTPDFNQAKLNSTNYVTNACLYLDFPYQNISRIPHGILELCNKNSTICCAYDATHENFLAASANHTFISRKYAPIEPICKQLLTSCQPYCCTPGNQ